MNIAGKMSRQDKLSLVSNSIGDLVMKSKVIDESRNIIKGSCFGKLITSVFIGKAGVGKSTLASLASNKADLFKIGTSSQGTTTHGCVSIFIVTR